MTIMTSRLLVLCFAALAGAALAQQPPAPPPPATPPAAPPTYSKPPDAAPPPMPDVTTPDSELEPQITIKRTEKETTEEVRVNGELRYIKVTPRYGLPYYLVPSSNGQTYLRYDSLDFGLKTPMWLLFSW
jgi:hypothetical protein